MHKLTAVSVQCKGQKRVAFVMLPVVTERSQFGQVREKVVCPDHVIQTLCAGIERGYRIIIS